MIAAAGVSVPFDLARSSTNIDKGFARVYQRYLLESLKRKAIGKHARYPDVASPERIAAIRNMTDFDDTLTAPIHGFESAADYYARSRSLGFLQNIHVDTFCSTRWTTPFSQQMSSTPSTLSPPTTRTSAPTSRHMVVTLALSVDGTRSDRVYYMERRVGEFLATRFQQRAHANTSPTPLPSHTHV